MAKPVTLWWNKCQGEVWADLFALNLGHAHFEALEGVFVVWHGGAKPEAVYVGQGLLREKIKQLRESTEIEPFRDQRLLVAWARAEKVLQDGVERFLTGALAPRLKTAPKNAMPVEVNLPGRPLPEGADPPKPDTVGQPDQAYEFMVVPGKNPAGLKVQDVQAQAPPAAVAPPPPPPAAPKIKNVTNLQKLFNEMMDKTKQPAAKGLFGSGGRPADAESLVVSAVQLILEEAVRMRTSDVHLEPQEGHLRVRFRVDGILEEQLEIVNTLNLRVVSHIRVKCNLDPEQSASTGKPQDGRMMVTVDGKEADLRLSTFPTPLGDKAVLRIIPRNVKVPKLEELSLSPQTVDRIRRLVHLPQGMIVVTGPAGSGKSTTLYTILQELNEPTRNIVTLEDPIELKIPGITQGALQPKAGFTFAEGLRSILRQDPNVVMVGEIRDPETAEIAMSAALTGHLLLTTLHTTSALGVVTRLLDMGLEPFLVSSAVTAVFAQRLVRQVCPNCREPHAPSAAELAQAEDMAKHAGIPLPAGSLKELSKGRGCKACRDTGFQGRLLLFEVVELSPPLRQLILNKAPYDDLRRSAVQSGALLLIMDGLRKAAEGLTTLDELTRVLGGGD